MLQRLERTAVLAVLIALFSTCSPKVERKERPARAKYIFLFIGNGLGTEQVHAAQLVRTLDRKKTLRGGLEGLGFTDFSAQGLVSTHSWDSVVTDSAAAATALATGHKTRNGFVGMAEDGETPLVSVAEVARDRGMRVGIVTSVSLDHATTAAFYAHQISHRYYYEIARDLAQSRFNFFAAGGFREPLPPTEPRPARGNEPASVAEGGQATSPAAGAAVGAAGSVVRDAQFSSAPSRLEASGESSSGIPARALPLDANGTTGAGGTAAASGAPRASAAPSASAAKPAVPPAKRKPKPKKVPKDLPIVQLLADNQYLVAKARLSKGEMVVGAPESGGSGMQVVPSVLEPVLEQSKWTLLLDENLDDQASLVSVIDRPKSSPGLADYTKKAIEKLSGSDGFFLLVEGGKIDWACQSNDAMSAFREVFEFVAAVDVAVDFLRDHAKDTLIVVTGDHETGGLTIGSQFGQDAVFMNRLLRQRMSGERFGRFVASELRRNPKAQLEDFASSLVADWNLELAPEAPTPRRPQLPPRKKTAPAVAATAAPAEAHNGSREGFEISGNKLTPAEVLELRDALEASRRRVVGKDAASDVVGPDPFSSVVMEAFSRRLGFNWATRGHTGGRVPIFAAGIGQEQFSGLLDNAEVGVKLLAAVRGKPAEVAEAPAESASGEGSASASPSGSSSGHAAGSARKE